MKNLLTAILCLVAAFANGQMLLTPTGIKSNKDQEATYIVLEYSGMSQADIYEAALTSLNQIYNSPKHVLESVEGVSIKVNARSNVISSQKLSLIEKQKYSVDYVVLLDFKDGRMRVSIPHIDYNQESLSGYNFVLVADKKAIGKKAGIWSQNLELQYDWLKSDTEKYFNDWIAWLDDSIRNYSSW